MELSNRFLGERERRQATILFADLSGFTGMAEKLDPEELTGIVNECLQIMGKCVEEHEGTIDKYIGDCIMAVFGVPISIEEAPLKAINTAIDIQNRIHQYSQSKKVIYPLDVHIGINTGMVISGPVGPEGKKEYTVMGDAVNIASRLKDISTSGQIYVGQNTYRYTKENFDYKIMEPLKVKGKQEVLRVYELIASKESKTSKAWRSDRMVFSALVGREKEMDKLSLQLIKLINGEGSIVNVIGEAGIGKSRLIAELKENRDIDRIQLLEGRAISSGKNLSFFPIINILKTWVGISEDDSDQQAMLKLEKKIEITAREDESEIFPFIATMMGLKLNGKYAERLNAIEGNALEKLILKGLDLLFIKISKQKPLVIVLEDLHWADISTIEILESLFRRTANYPILYVNVFRPGYKESSERMRLTIHSRYPQKYIDLWLKPLSLEDGEKLIRNLLHIQRFPADVKEKIINRTSGNPFFIEEIIRSFIDDEIIVVKNGKFEVTARIDSVIIPESINEVIMARIDRLDEDSRSLLKIASVIGRSFFYKILIQFSEIQQDVDSRLAVMEEMQLILKQLDKEEIAYLFKHALAQEAVYESILLKRRKELHLKTAHIIEEIFWDKINEFYGILAWHYSKAEDYKKAEEFLSKAGEEALRTSASSEAINYFRDALEIYQARHDVGGQMQKIADMEQNIAFALMNKGQFGEAIRYIEDALKYYGIKTRANKWESLLTVISGSAHLLIALYIPWLKWKKAPSTEDEKLSILMFRQYFCLGFIMSDQMPFLGFRVIKRLVAFDLSKSEKGIEQFLEATFIFTYTGISHSLHRKILSFLEEKVNWDDPVKAMSFKVSLCLNCRMDGIYKSHVFDDVLVERSFQLGNLQSASYYIIFSFFIDLGQGRFHEAAHKIGLLEEMKESFDNFMVEGWIFMAKSKLFTKQRDLSKGLIYVEKFIDFCKKVDDKAQTLWGYVSKAYLQLLMEDVQGADQSMNHIPPEYHQTMILVFKTTLVLSQLSIDLYYLQQSIQNKTSRLNRKLIKKTRKSCQDAIRVAQKMADDRIEILKLAGTFYWIMGKQKTAAKWWKKSIMEGEKMSALPELSRTYMEVGRRLKEPDSKLKYIYGMNAENYLEKAAGIFEDLGLEWDKKILNNYRLR